MKTAKIGRKAQFLEMITSKTHSSCLLMNWYLLSKRPKRTGKLSKERKINNFEYGRKTDQPGKVVWGKFVRQISSQPSLQLTLKFRAKSMWQRQLVSLFLSRDQRIEKIDGNLLRRNVKCSWCNRCWRPNKKKLKGWLNMPPCTRMVWPALKTCWRRIPKPSWYSSTNWKTKPRMPKRNLIKEGGRKMRKPMNKGLLSKKLLY